MKLLNLHIKSGDLSGGILEGFRITFHENELGEGKITPVCFVGINGSGKSQLLQVIAEVFFYLDRCFRSFKPSRKPTNLLFEVEYLTWQEKEAKHVKVERLSEKGGPVVSLMENGIPNRLEDPILIEKLLPSKIVGYTSGENETLSVPFLDTYQEYAEFVTQLALPTKETDYQQVPDTRLLMIDYSSNISILVANFLYREPGALEVFERVVKVFALQSFRLIFQFRHKAAPSKRGVFLTEEHRFYLERLKKCATCYDHDKSTDTWTLDFFVNEETQDAFRHHFLSAFELYSCFAKFELLNSLIIPEKHLKQINKLRKEQGMVVKPPTVYEENKIFRFQTVKLKTTLSKEAIDYIALSDGEHQFIQIFGTVLMIENDNVLFLLDEPESHFNPNWRIKFITLLESLALQRKQEFIITSHSPFLLSDIRRDHVFVFEKKFGKVKAGHPDAETYGATFDSLLKEAFGVDPPVSGKSLKEIRGLQKSTDFHKLEQKISKFGDSVEKFYLYQRIAELKKGKKK